MRIRSSLHALGAALISTGMFTVHAADAPYYNPANPSSPSGYTNDYQAYKTIGCPGKALLEGGCDQTAAAKAAPLKDKVSAPVASADEWLHSYVYIPTGIRESSGLMIERLLPKEVVAGQPFDYQLKATNLTPTTLKDVSVEDLCADNFTVVSSDPPVSQEKGNNLTWNLGEMQGNATQTIKVRGSFPTGASAPKSCMSGNYDPTSCQAFNVVEPKLSLTANAPAEVLRCEPIPVHYVVSNPGTGISRQSALNQAVPQGLASKDGTSMTVVAFGDLAPGVTRSADAVFTASAPGTYEFRPVAVAEPALKADAVTSTHVTQPVLKVEKQMVDNLIMGRDLSYEIGVTNTGDAVARNLVVTESIPAGAQLKSATDGGQLVQGRMVWHLPDLPPAKSTSVKLSLQPQVAGTVETSTRAAAYCAVDATAEGKTSVVGVPAILLEMVDLVDPVPVGSDTTYVITVTNQGTAPDLNVRINADLETSMQFVSAEGATTPTATGAHVEFAPLARLEPGAKAVWKVIVKAVEPADARFSVNLFSDMSKRPVIKTEATTFYK